MSATDASRAKQPHWQVPTRTAQEPTLKVYNSLTRSKVDFVTKKPGIVTWYNCGPTVYDSSHMGHARNYLTQDVMRRILRDYFGYEVNFVMNITDVDDKIILRARHSHLLSNYISQTATSLSSTVLSDTQTAWSAYVFKTLASSLPDQPPTSSASPSFDAARSIWAAVLEKEQSPQDKKWADEQRAKQEKWTMYLSAVKVGLRGIEEAEKAIKDGRTDAEEARKLVESNKDALSIWLDKQFGATVTDPAIFRDLAAYWEDSYFKSMSSLKIERPTTLTRVSEYLPEIVDFVHGLVEKDKAYVVGGDVWFNTAKFDGAAGPTTTDGEEQKWEHSYAKLQPWSKGNRELLEDGEGSLTNGGTKRSASDFALWKSSKSGEPAWPSPWGPGRPGWHIECSVMASAILGSNMDVHSGGIDLAFPHHDNELAQSEAYHNCRQWVNYFLHTGHLHIEGLKMSKSLKNFITIEEALERHSARQLRFAFLLTTWNAKLDFKESAMQEVRGHESAINNFFANVNALVQEAKANPVASDAQHHYEQAERDISEKLEQSQLAFREALCDSFDTPRAIQVILDLVSASNIYLSRGRGKVNTGVVAAVSEWVTRMLRMFGLGEGSPVDSTGSKVVGWGKAVAEGESGDRDTIVMPYLYAVSAFRDQVRKLAMEGAPASALLELSDRFRDYDMVELGVALDDQPDGKAKVKTVDADTLRRARDEKLAIAQEKAARKAATAAAAEAKRLEKLEKGRTPPKEMFKPPHTDEYTQWDEETGLPTLDKEGQPVGKSKVKKLMKEQDVQKKLHDEFLKAQ
ncbi:hypothetical protein T439DRAFT_325700 [Meredithblackwellia eburnea MCA 4105]